MSFSAVALVFGLMSALQSQATSLLCMSFFKHDVVVGQQATLRERVPLIMPGKVVIVMHACSRVKRYDWATRRMVGEPVPVRLVNVDGFKLPGGLPESDVNPRGMTLDADEFGLKGVTYGFTPPEPGVYEFSAVWTVRGFADSVTGPPARLTVLPAAAPKAP